jgi:hypothetical protein
MGGKNHENIVKTGNQIENSKPKKKPIKKTSRETRKQRKKLVKTRFKSIVGWPNYHPHAREIGFAIL